MSNIISVSLGKNHLEFLRDSGISPSALLQNSINQLIESDKVSTQVVKDLKANILRLREMIFKQGDFIDRKGLMDEFMKQ